MKHYRTSEARLGQWRARRKESWRQRREFARDLAGGDAWIIRCGFGDCPVFAELWLEDL